MNKCPHLKTILTAQDLIMVLSVKAHFSLINDHFIYYQLAPLND